MFGLSRTRVPKRQARSIQKDLTDSKLRDAKEKRRFDESISLYNRAIAAEKAGRYNQALKLYLENLDLYSPQGLSHWERPAILLEKLKRYDEALVLCERALALDVEHGPTAASIREKFTKRRERLTQKLK